jgi:dihydrofolate reductase
MRTYSRRRRRRRRRCRFPRTRLDCKRGTSFEFVTGGIDAALKLARAAADGKDVAVSGGGTVARQYLAAGLLDEIELHLVPVLLGAGVRL